jgi:bacillithiol synthase
VKIVRRPLGGSAFVRDWLAGRSPAADFLRGEPGRDGGDLDRERVAGALEGGGPESESRLRSFLARDGFVVTTGQQAVLFGGPLYVVYKALSAVALAEHLEARLGRPVLPVFWIASEDHDWEEARALSVLDPENELRRVELSTEPEGSPPLHRIVPGDALPRALDELLAHLPPTDFAPRWTELLRQACTPRATLPEAMAGILDGLFGELGLFRLQAHAPLLKEATVELLLSELEASERSEALLRARAGELEDAGYDLQVPIPEGGTNLFMEGKEGRDRLMREDGGFRLRRSGERWSLAEIRSRVRDEPAILSPNVLLRPVVESAFLPTLAYVAGPGEIAYLAQTAPLFELHGVPRPGVRPRVSLELVEAKVSKVLAKYGLEAEALARPHHELAGDLVRDDLPEPIRRSLGAFRGAVGERAKELAEAVSDLDPTLRGPVEQLRSQGFAQVAEVERKVVQALKRENRIALAQLEKAQRHLYPEGRPQERVLTPWYHFFRYGSDLMDRLAAEARAALASEEAESPLDARGSLSP